MDADHLPYSFWPSRHVRRNSRVELGDTRRRLSKNPRFSITEISDSEPPQYPQIHQIFKQSQ